MILFNLDYKTNPIEDNVLLKLVGCLYVYQEDDSYFLEGTIVELIKSYKRSLVFKVLTPENTIQDYQPSRDYLSLLPRPLIKMKTRK